MALASSTIIAIAAVAGATAAVGTTAYQIHHGEEMKRSAEQAQDRAINRQSELEKEAKTRAANEESAENQARTRDAAARRQRALAAGAQGRSSTLLTGPSGLSGSSQNMTQAAATPAYGGKTLLGS